jgi:hypothetical protein
VIKTWYHIFEYYALIKIKQLILEHYLKKSLLNVMLYIATLLISYYHIVFI